MTIGNILITAVVGLCVVFLILIILMCAIYIMTAIFKKLGKKEIKTDNTASVVPEKAEEQKEKAPGSCGELQLIKTTDREAAMIMAIVADELGVPLNTLRFKKIELIGE